MVAAERAAPWDGVRVFKHFAWLEVGSGNVALFGAAHTTRQVPRTPKEGLREACGRFAHSPFEARGSRPERGAGRKPLGAE